MPCVYSRWFSHPDLATGEAVWLDRVKIGQHIEILVSELYQQFILLPSVNDILFSLFSIDKIALCVFLDCLNCSNKILQIEWLGKKTKFVSHSSEAGGLRSGCPCGQVRALLYVTGFPFILTWWSG